MLETNLQHHLLPIINDPPNAFLLTHLHDEFCFCPARCRIQKLQMLNTLSTEQLRNVINTELCTGRRLKSELLYQFTIRQICHGKQYHSKCLNGTGITYFKCWASRQPYYSRYVNGDDAEKKMFEDHCHSSMTQLYAMIRGTILSTI